MMRDGRQGGQGAQGLGMKARAGGIGDDHVGPDALGEQGGQDVTHLAGEKGAVGDLVGRRVAHGVGHRGLGQLDAVDAAAAPGEEQADGPRPRVEVHEGLAPRQLRRLRDDREQPLRLPRVGLEERVGGDLEGHAVEALRDVVPPVEHVLLGAHGDAGLLAVDVEHHAGRGGDPGRRASATGASASTSGAAATMLTMASPVRCPSRSVTKRSRPSPVSWS